MADAEVPVCGISQSSTSFYIILSKVGNYLDAHNSVPSRRRQPYGLATSKYEAKARGGRVAKLNRTYINQYTYADI